jgi:serum/glucocorticoid-regulated kinase 2
MGNEASKSKRKLKKDSSKSSITESVSDLRIDESLQRSIESTAKISTQDFDLVKVIGRGSFGRVFLVRKNRGKDENSIYAMKVLRKDILLQRNQVEHTKHERAILQISGPFICKLAYAFQTSDKLYLVTDFCSGGELFFWLKRERIFSIPRVQLYAAELVLALAHLHNMDIVYRDLKPENILLDSEGHIKLTDFGLSKMHVEDYFGGARTFCGTPEYLAPEILESGPSGHGKAVDWWSLGTLLYEMVAGLPPFYDTNAEIMFTRILTEELVFPSHFPSDFRSLLSGLLTRNVEDRLGSRGVDELKSHPFFATINWNAVLAKTVKPIFIPPMNGVENVGLWNSRGNETGVSSEGAVLTNFEEEFTSEAPVESLIDERDQLSSTAIERAHFPGFTFVGGSDPLQSNVASSHGSSESNQHRHSVPLSRGFSFHDASGRESFVESPQSVGYLDRSNRSISTGSNI